MEDKLNGFGLNNVLDKEFKQMLFPLNLMQSALLQPKYRIVRGVVNKNNYFSYILCLLGLVFMTLITASRLFSGTFDSSSKLAGYMYTVAAITTMKYIISGVTMFTLNVYQAENNVLLILKIQQAYRVISNADDLKKHRNLTWLCIILTVFVFIFYLEGHRQIGLINTRFVVYMLSLLYFDGNVIFALRIINFLVHEVRLWMVKMDSFLTKCLQTNHIQLTKHLDGMRLEGEALLKAYMDIIGAFQLCGKIFHMPILLLAVEIFIQPLIFIQLFIEISKVTQFAPFMTTVSILILLTLVSKNLVLLVSVCVASQKFCLAIADADVACMVATSDEGCLADAHRLCKNVRRVNACAIAGRGLRAGGALAVDAALPLRLLALLATYTVVLLQFAFL